MVGGLPVGFSDFKLNVVVNLSHHVEMNLLGLATMVVVKVSKALTALSSSPRAMNIAPTAAMRGSKGPKPSFCVGFACDFAI
jgi:hypothetical protein